MITIEHRKADPAVADAGVVGQLSDLLGHQRGADIQRASGETNCAAQQDDAHAHDGVKSQAQGQHHRDGCEGDKGVYALGGADQGEHQHQERNKNAHLAAEPAHNGGNQSLEGAGGRQHMDGRAAEEDQGNQVSVSGESVDDQHGKLNWADADIVHIGKGGCVHDFASGDGVLNTGVFAAGNHPSECRCNEDDDNQDDKGMGHGKAFLLCLRGGSR